jgi:hypothetical protein
LLSAICHLFVLSLLRVYAFNFPFLQTPLCFQERLMGEAAAIRVIKEQDEADVSRAPLLNNAASSLKKVKIASPYLALPCLATLCLAFSSLE